MPGGATTALFAQRLRALFAPVKFWEVEFSFADLKPEEPGCGRQLPISAWSSQLLLTLAWKRVSKSYLMRWRGDERLCNIDECTRSIWTSRRVAKKPSVQFAGDLG
jgi:hypothetical protein